MRFGFPDPPNFGFSWRNLLVEPVPFSGEKISVAGIVKADDGTLIVPKFVSRHKFRSLFGAKFGVHISDMLSICIECAEEHFQKNPIYLDWKPPISSFHIGDTEHSMAVDLEEAILIVGKYCSSMYVSEKTSQHSFSESRKPPPLHRLWESEIRSSVGMHRSSFELNFDRCVYLKEGGVRLNFGFLSEKYAAQFEAVSKPSSLQGALVRAQAKLWQLNLLRDEKDIFGVPSCELLLGLPQSEKVGRNRAIMEFVEELKYEASKRELEVYTASSPAEAAMHVIEKAAI